ncbi:signal peptidase [Nitrincola sp. A-D6]|uniref:signal peptidase II n=1 Tax=Nitrincola sp. A-D6 TaxID=1545442 RepID=UPI00051F9A03|nr:signal peptidase II [Nitrincola sp. A-D6]KGK41469.1 signal peptidase [Nitrincola sp. A-D6]
MPDSDANTVAGTWWRWLGLTLLVVLLDLGSKWLATDMLVYARPVPLLPFFDLTLLHNPGAAFSFLAGAGGWQRWFFVGITLMISGVLLVWLKRTPAQQWWMRLALALILGGALGNLYDRMLHGYVVDFISLHYGGWYFPAFNLADSAITVGAAILIIDMLFISGRAEKPTR